MSIMPSWITRDEAAVIERGVEALPPHETAIAESAERCTGYVNDSGRTSHDGDTCPVHEDFEFPPLTEEEQALVDAGDAIASLLMPPIDDSLVIDDEVVVEPRRTSSVWEAICECSECTVPNDGFLDTSAPVGFVGANDEVLAWLDEQEAKDEAVAAIVSDAEDAALASRAEAIAALDRLYAAYQAVESLLLDK